MIKYGIICLALLFQTACSVKNKEVINKHEEKANDAVLLEKNSNSVVYKEKIHTQEFYETSLDKKKDTYKDLLLPLSKIVLNVKHLDDSTLYNEKDLKYSLQIFQSQFLYLLQTDPKKAEPLTKDYLAFLSYKCTDNLLTDCKSHVFLKQDSNSSPILLKISQFQSDLKQKIELLKLALALQNSAKSDVIKAETIKLMVHYINQKTEIKKEKQVSALTLKDNGNEAKLIFQRDLQFFITTLKTFETSAEELKELHFILSLKNSSDILGKELYSLLFLSLSQIKITDEASRNRIADQWYEIIKSNEANHDFSWSQLKQKVSPKVKIETMSLSDLKKQSLDALLIYQVATELSAQTALTDLETKKEFLVKNPELTLKIFETQLKLHFFSLAQETYKLIKKDLSLPAVVNAAPQELLDIVTSKGNAHLQPLWAGYAKVVEHFSYFVSQTFGSMSPTAQKFRNFQDSLEISEKVFVLMPMMFIVLHYIDKKQYSEKIIVSDATKSTVTLSAPLLLFEILQGRMPSFFFTKSEKEATKLNQYQVFYSLAATTMLELPQFFGIDKEAFLKSFAIANVRVPTPKIEKVENSLENIGFGAYDKNQNYSLRTGKVHEALKICENPRSVLISMELKDIRGRTFLGSMDSMDSTNPQFKLFAELAFYNNSNPYNTSIDEMLESVRSEIDPLLDQLALLEQIGNIRLVEKENLKERRDKILNRVVELEKKVVACSLKLDQIERARQKRFLKREIDLHDKMIAIAYWIESSVLKPALPTGFKEKSSLNKNQKIDFAQNWLLENVYAPLKTAAPQLYEELKDFSFFSIGEEDSTLLINTRSINSYYRLALWTQEPEQQQEARISINFTQPFQLLIKEFQYATRDSIFKTNQTSFKDDQYFLERELYRNHVKDFTAWEMGVPIQVFLKSILKVKTAAWKMAGSKDWNPFTWVECKNECQDKRKKESSAQLRKIIDTSIGFTSYFQIQPEDEAYLRAIGVHSYLRHQTQIKSNQNYHIFPDFIFTKIANSSQSSPFMGLADNVFHLSTSYHLGTRPLYSLTDKIFTDSGQNTQSGLNTVDSGTVHLEAADLFSRRTLPLDLQDEKKVPSQKILELSFLGDSLNRTAEEQFILSINKDLDRNFRYLIIAPTIRELELRDVLFDTIKEYESDWKKPSLRFALNAESFNNPWLVSSSYIHRTLEQQKEFHRLTKGAFELKKWYAPTNEKKQ